MISRACIIALAFSLTSGCVHPEANKVAAPEIRQVVAPYQQYIAKNVDWTTIQRIVLVPLANQTAYPRASAELQTNLAAELQRAGRFDVVVATRDDTAARAQDVFASGQFNEMEVLRIAREHQADAVLFVNLTQYHPYSPPRVGLSMLLVSPSEGIAIATTSGLWDAREASTSMQALAYFKQTQNWPRSLLGNERVIQSPDVFQRFVCQQIASSLQPPSIGGGVPNGSIMNSAMLPAEGMAPPNDTNQNNMELPPVPPSSMEVP